MEGLRASVWWPGFPRARLGTFWKSKVTFLPPPSREPTIHRINHWGRVRCHVGGSGGDGPRRPRPGQQRLILGTWNVTSLGGKELELVLEVERYQLDLVGLTSTHSTGSGSKLLDRGWTLFSSGVAKGVRHRAGMGILTSQPLSATVLRFTLLDERDESINSFIKYFFLSCSMYNCFLAYVYKILWEIMVVKDQYRLWKQMRSRMVLVGQTFSGQARFRCHSSANWSH